MNDNKNKQKYYIQLMLNQERINNDILKGYYKSKCVADLYNIIKQETQRYTSKLLG